MAEATRDKTARLVSATLLAAYGWTSFLFVMAANWQWMKAAPRQPDAALGLVYPHNAHGTDLYMSAFQSTSISLVFLTSIPLFFLAMWMMPKRNVRVSKSRFAIQADWDLDGSKLLVSAVFGLGMLATVGLLYFAGPPVIGALNAAGFVLHLG